MLAKNSYKQSLLINELVKETELLGKVAQMQISPEQGKFLEIIVSLIRAKHCLEIGRFTGLSTLCIAKGLPSDGTVTTIDNSNEFLNLAKKYWEKEGVEKNQYDNQKCNVGTNFKTGVSINKDSHAYIIIMPPRASKAGFKNKYGIVNF